MDRNLEQGFTLIEVLVSMVIITLLLTVISTLIFSSNNVTNMTDSRENGYNLVNKKISELQSLPQNETQETCEEDGNFKLCWEIVLNSEPFGTFLLATVTATWNVNGRENTCSLSGIVQAL